MFDASQRSHEHTEVARTGQRMGDYASAAGPRSQPADDVHDRFMAQYQMGQRAGRRPQAPAQTPFNLPGSSSFGMTLGNPDLPFGNSAPPLYAGHGGAPLPEFDNHAQQRSLVWAGAQIAPGVCVPVPDHARVTAEHPAQHFSGANAPPGTNAALCNEGYRALTSTAGEALDMTAVLHAPAPPRSQDGWPIRQDDERGRLALTQGDMARTATAVPGSSSAQDDRRGHHVAGEERFKQFCVHTEPTDSGPAGNLGATGSAGPSSANFGHNVQTSNSYMTHNGPQEDGGDTGKKPQEKHRTGPRYPLDGPQPTGHDWYCCACRRNGKRVYWLNEAGAKLHVSREHPVHGKARHELARGSGSGTKRKKQQPKDVGETE